MITSRGKQDAHNLSEYQAMTNTNNTIIDPVLTYVDTEENNALRLYATLACKDGVFVSLTSGDSVDSIKADLERFPRYSDWKVMSWEDFYVLEEKAKADRYKVGQPKPITKERFYEMLKTLPPQRWDISGAREAFRFMECLDGNLFSFFVRVGNKYFEVINDAQASYEAIYKSCNAFTH